MSGYRGHLVFGLLVLLGLLGVFHFSGAWVFGDFDLGTTSSQKMALLFIPIAGFMALLPDIDIPTSKISHFVSGVFLLGALVCLGVFYFLEVKLLLLLGALFISFVFLSLFFEHRGRWHSPVVGLLLGAPLWYFSPLFFVVAVAGYWSHLFLDMF